MPRIRSLTQTTLLSVLLLLLGGCVAFAPKPAPLPPQAQASLAHADSLYRAGDFRGAAEAYRALANANPAVRDRALLGAAASDGSQGKFADSAALLQQIDRHHLGANDDARYRVLAAEIALHRGQPAAALQWLARLPSPLPADLQRQALDVDARAQLSSGNRLAAARALVQRLPLLAPAAVPASQQRIVAILAGIGKAGLTPLSSSLADTDPLKPFVQQALAQSGAGMPRVLPQLNQPVGTLAAGTEAPLGYVMPARVAVLLPATGPVAVAGAAVRDGFFTAYFHAPAEQQPRPSVRVYDTGGTPEGALAAYRQAVADGATFVVGPLGRAAVSAVFSQPSLPVPVLALNHPQGDATAPVGSTEFALLPEAEGAQLAAHMVQQGLHAATVFREDSPTATRTFNAFKAQFTSLGGQVANDIVLPQGAVDFSSQIQAALAGSGSDTGIVVLLRPLQARLLLPQLKLARSTLPVMATSMVYSGTPNEVADGDLDGVQFCDEPWLYDAQAGLPDPVTMASLLQTASGPAARLFAFGMDAYDLVPYLGWLRTHPGSYLPGATGQLTMDASGEVLREPIWLQFHGGIARPAAAGLEDVPPAPATTSGP
ncbi:MAG TPA: penicillin-binding protein activator [Rhodanobacteraceae bacterium]|nr:penicillin-binding protein activator [Rhodanobacteraceae bacterium]